MSTCAHADRLTVAACSFGHPPPRHAGGMAADAGYGDELAVGGAFDHVDGARVSSNRRPASVFRTGRSGSRTPAGRHVLRRGCSRRRGVPCRRRWCGSLSALSARGRDVAGVRHRRLPECRPLSVRTRRTRPRRRAAGRRPGAGRRPVVERNGLRIDQRDRTGEPIASQSIDVADAGD